MGTLPSGFGFGGCRLHETERARRFGLGGCRLHETERARRFATVAEVEVVRCITSRSDQTGKYFSYNFGVVFSLLSFFSRLLFSSLLVFSLPFSSSPFVFSSLFFSPRLVFWAWVWGVSFA